LRLSLVSGNMLESVSRGRLESMYWVFILAGPLILFTWIRSFRYLAFTSIIGIICVMCRACVVRVSCGDAVLNNLSCCSTQQAILRWCWP
jgi:amino acid permease